MNSGNEEVGGIVKEQYGDLAETM
ncbi:hypothetical protein Tco_0111830, partial [Tanacetum coccineum]